MTFELPKLDYSNDALAPVMSQETLELHHGKHHQTYINNLNKFIKDTDMSKMSLEEIILKTSKDKSKIGIFNNSSQHWNHILFWKCMKPKGGGTIPTKLKKYNLKLIDDGNSFHYHYNTGKERTGITSLLSDMNAIGINLFDIQTEETSLEDIFVKIIKD